jgi:membrane fusion protein, multidrug efflux system
MKNDQIASNPAMGQSSFVDTQAFGLTPRGRGITRNLASLVKGIMTAGKAIPAPPAWIVLVFIVLLGIAFYFYVPAIFYAETDDAYVQADNVSVVPKVSAYVVALHVTDNSSFKKGQLLVELDPRDFAVAVASAEANVAGAQAAVENAKAEVDEQNSIIAADAAMLTGDAATLSFAKQQLFRFAKLATDEAGTVEDFQQAQSNIGQRQAVLMRDQASLGAARSQLQVLQTRVAQANAQVAASQAVLARADLNLSYTKIYADISGTVANRTVQVGNYVQAGQGLFSAVPDEVYIVANFKETQLASMHVGQPVAVNVDAVPGVTFKGHIDSFQRGTGSYFALLPPENATGNFIKVVQRVPVKILLEPGQEASVALSPGMSVEASVQIKPVPSWLPDFIKNWLI